jgi:Ca2+/Na+ antiporter
VNLQVRSGALKSSKAFRWTVGVGASVMVALGLVLLFLLTLATGNRELYERNYALLFALNIAVAVLLLLVIGWIALRLGMRPTSSSRARLKAGLMSKSKARWLRA